MMQLIDPASNLTMDTILDMLPEPWHVTVYAPSNDTDDDEEYSSHNLKELSMKNPSKKKIKALLYTTATHQFKNASFDIRQGDKMPDGRIELTKYKLDIKCYGKPTEQLMDIFIKGTECNDIEILIIKCKTWFPGITTTTTTTTNGDQ